MPSLWLPGQASELKNYTLILITIGRGTQRFFFLSISILPSTINKSLPTDPASYAIAIYDYGRAHPNPTSAKTSLDSGFRNRLSSANNIPYLLSGPHGSNRGTRSSSRRSNPDSPPVYLRPQDYMQLQLYRYGLFQLPSCSRLRCWTPASRSSQKRPQ